MTIVVKPHNKNEEMALLAFLDRMKYDYSREEPVSLSEAQLKEILDRDDLYEAGKTENFSLDEIIAHFKLEK